MQTKVLNEIMNRRGYTKDKLAERIGINPATFYRKQSGKSAFTIDEAQRIQAVLDITDTEMIEIFLHNNSHKCENAS